MHSYGWALWTGPPVPALRAPYLRFWVSGCSFLTSLLDFIPELLYRAFNAGLLVLLTIDPLRIADGLFLLQQLQPPRDLATRSTRLHATVTTHAVAASRIRSSSPANHTAWRAARVGVRWFTRWRARVACHRCVPFVVDPRHAAFAAQCSHRIPGHTPLHRARLLLCPHRRLNAVTHAPFDADAFVIVQRIAAERHLQTCWHVYALLPTRTA